jgi:hypothetical protein
MYEILNSEREAGGCNDSTIIIIIIIITEEKHKIYCSEGS